MKTATITDNDLVRRIAAGSEHSFAILHNRYHRKVQGYINLFIRRQDVVDDIAQEVFIKAYRSLKEGHYQENGKFVPWIMRIAKNMVIDYYRKDSPIFVEDGSPSDLKMRNMPSDESPDLSLMKKQQQFRIKSLINELPKEQREVVLLRYYIGLSFKEIAEYTNVSINTALGRMRYALINLKKRSDLIERY